MLLIYAIILLTMAPALGKLKCFLSSFKLAITITCLVEDSMRIDKNGMAFPINRFDNNVKSKNKVIFYCRN